MTSQRLTDESSIRASNPRPPLPPPNRQSYSRHRHETDTGRRQSDVTIYRSVATSEVPNGTLRKKVMAGQMAVGNGSFAHRIAASPSVGSVPPTECCRCCGHAGSRVPSMQISDRFDPSPASGGAAAAAGAHKWRQQTCRETFCSNDSSKTVRSVRHIDSNATTTYHIEVKNSCHTVIYIGCPSSTVDFIESSTGRSNTSSATESIEISVRMSDGVEKVEHDYDVVGEKRTITDDDYVQMGFPISDVETAINSGLVRFKRSSTVACTADSCSYEHRTILRRPVITGRQDDRRSESPHDEYEGIRL